VGNQQVERWRADLLLAEKKGELLSSKEKEGDLFQQGREGNCVEKKEGVER
jgi:hypothetical protein